MLIDRLRLSTDIPTHDGAAASGGPDFRIGRDGTWFYHGSPIRRKPLVKLFSTVLQREADGSFWLVTPVEKAPVAVDDAPFVAVAVSASGAGADQRLRFRTNLDEEIDAGPVHPIRVEEDPETRAPAPYLRVRAGLDALIARSVFYQLVELGLDDPARGELMLWSGGTRFSLGRLPTADAEA